MKTRILLGQKKNHSKISANSSEEVLSAYKKIAKYYDYIVRVFRLLGYDYVTYRSRAISALHLKRGQAVVELGCGTGINFPKIIQNIGKEGRLIGVDLTPEMLEIADQKVKKEGWTNVELIKADMANYDFPENVDAIISTGAFGWLDNPEQVIKKACSALNPGGRFVLLDLKRPNRWPSLLFKIFFEKIGAIAGVNSSYVSTHPWEAVNKYFDETDYEERYGGAMYLSKGIKLNTILFSNKENKEIVKNLYKLWNIGQLADLWEHIAPNCVFRNESGDVISAERLTSYMNEITKAFPYRRIECKELVAEEDKVFSLYLDKSGPMKADFMEHPVTAKQYSIPTVEFYRFSNGKIVEIQLIRDSILIENQLGFSLNIK